jgi:hypothetical protein
LIKENGKENVRNMFGVKRNVFDTWLKSCDWQRKIKPY